MICYEKLKINSGMKSLDFFSLFFHFWAKRLSLLPFFPKFLHFRLQNWKDVGTSRVFVIHISHHIPDMVRGGWAEANFKVEYLTVSVVQARQSAMMLGERRALQAENTRRAAAVTGVVITQREPCAYALYKSEVKRCSGGRERETGGRGG